MGWMLIIFVMFTAASFYLLLLNGRMYVVTNGSCLMIHSCRIRILTSQQQFALAVLEPA
jgi:hypothetical protein